MKILGFQQHLRGHEICLLEPPDSQREGIQGSWQEICIILVTNISSKMIDEKNIRFAAILRKSNEMFVGTTWNTVGGGCKEAHKKFS